MRHGFMGACGGLGAAVVLVLTALAPAHADTVVPWVNGDFELGGATWSAPAATTFVDADGDGDIEAKLLACGDGTWQISRGATKGDVPATTHLELDVERGELYIYSFRMIIMSVSDPVRWANNLLNVHPALPTYNDEYWFDDQVLAWEDWQSHGPLSGHVDLDPLVATGYNIPGWDTMSPEQRADFLTTSTHMTLVVYGCAGGFEGGATLDNFAWAL